MEYCSCKDCGNSISRNAIRCRSCAYRIRNLSKKINKKCTDCGKKIGRRSNRCVDCNKKFSAGAPRKCRYCDNQLTDYRSEQCFKCFTIYVASSEEFKNNKIVVSRERALANWKDNEARKNITSEKMKKFWEDAKNRENMLKSTSDPKLGGASKLQNSFEDELFIYGFIKNMKVGNYLIDYCNKFYKIAIEINGDYWHCNPADGWEAEDLHPHLNKTAQEIWDKDAKRIKELTSMGYKVIIIWEASIKVGQLSFEKMMSDLNIKANIIDKYKGWSSEKILEDLTQYRLKYSVCIENWQYNYNLGTCIRAANAFGAKEVFYIGNKKIDDRSSVGTKHWVDFKYLQSLDQLIDLKKKYVLVSMDNLEGAQDISKFDWPENSLIILGNEANGISKEVLKISDYVVSIPQRGSVRSLNVTTAAGIAMYSYLQQHG